MIKRSLFFLLILPAVWVFSDISPSRVIYPYFLKPNSTYLGLAFDDIGIREGSLFGYTLYLDYGINENIMLGGGFPYISMVGANDSGVFGDVFTYVKLSIAQSAELTWRVLTDFFFRFPTGIPPLEASRKIKGGNASYYPFSSGEAQFAPSVIGILMFDNYVASGVVSYVSESSPNENIFSFNPLYDRLDFQCSLDYLFKFQFSQDYILYLRPDVILEYKYNLSDVPIIPSGFYASVELNIKLESWKLKMSVTAPVGVKNALSLYQLAFQAGHYF
jgi:hypothetical protein